MTDLRTAAQQALDEWRDNPGSVRMASLMIALQNAIFEDEQRAINAAELQQTHSTECWRWHHECAISKIQWMHTPLTDAEIDRVTDAQWAVNNHKPIYVAHRAFARAIERAHGIGVKE